VTPVLAGCGAGDGGVGQSEFERIKVGAQDVGVATQIQSVEIGQSLQSCEVGDVAVGAIERCDFIDRGPAIAGGFIEYACLQSGVSESAVD
jgi:hypothetical protein